MRSLWNTLLLGDLPESTLKDSQIILSVQGLAADSDDVNRSPLASAHHARSWRQTRATKCVSCRATSL
jgi:hypothetical protein